MARAETAGGVGAVGAFIAGAATVGATTAAVLTAADDEPGMILPKKSEIPLVRPEVRPEVRPLPNPPEDFDALFAIFAGPPTSGIIFR